MTSLTRLLLFFFVAGLFARSSAADFAEQIPAGGFMYVEVKNTDEYQKRFSEFPALQDLKDFDWKGLILQVYQISIEQTRDANGEDDTPAVEELDKFITSIQEKWADLNSHLTGEIAFSLGDFQETFDVFSENTLLRENLGLESPEVGEDELTEEQLAQQEKRLLEEERLDEREIASVFGQVQVWVGVKPGDGQDEKLESWLVDMMAPDEEDDYTLTSQAWEGTTYHSIHSPGEEEFITFCWAIKDGCWIITFTTEALKEAVDAFSNPPADALAHDPAFTEALEYVGPYDTLFYFDFLPLDRLLKRSLEKIPDDQTGIMPQTETILEWLGIDAWIPYVLGSRLNEKGVVSKGRMGFNRETALSRIFIDPDAGPAEIPSFIHVDFHQFSAFDWHLGNGWSRLEKEISTLSPQAAAGMGIGRMLASGQLGFDPKLQFLDHLEGNTFFVQTIDAEVIEKMMDAAKDKDLTSAMQVRMEHPTGGQNYLLGFKMKSQVAVQEAMDRLLNRFHPAENPEPVDLDGQAIYYPIPAELQGGKFQKFISYTFLDGYMLLAIGDDTLIRKAILASKDPSLQLINNEDFKTLRSSLASDAIALEYANGKQQEDAMNVIQSSLSMLQAEHPDLDLPDVSLLGGIIKQSMSSSVRRGLIYELESFVEFTTGE